VGRRTANYENAYAGQEQPPREKPEGLQARFLSISILRPVSESCNLMTAQVLINGQTEVNCRYQALTIKFRSLSIISTSERLPLGGVTRGHYLRSP
jgi:hypothetical protein